jgi:O-antigen ligase
MSSTVKNLTSSPLSAARPYLGPRQEAALNRSTAMDRFLLVAAIVLLPLQEQVSILAGPNFRFSFMWIVFALMGLYVAVTRPQSLLKAAAHPVFRAAYILLILGFLVESVHVDSDYVVPMSYAYMIGGAVVVAALCRDRQSLKAVFYGYIGSSLWLAIFLILTFYGQFQGATATNLNEATSVRDAIFKDNSLATGLNTMASIIAQGTVLALTLTLTSISSRRRTLLLLVTLALVVASFLPMSRGGVLMILVSSAAVMIAYRGKRLRALIAVAILAAGVAFWVPNVVFTRLMSSTTTSYYSSLVAHSDQEDADGRSRVYSAAVQSFPDYVAFGVGAGNYWKSWAYAHGLGSRRGVSGMHNCFLQVTVYWGLPGLLAFLGVLICAYRCLPKRCGLDPLSLGLLGLACLLLVWMLMIHNVYDKNFSLGLGLLVSARLWIWPKGVVLLASRGRARKLSAAAARILSLRTQKQREDLKGLRRAPMARPWGH